uniref:NADH dehydrogenase subunit 6 n=1 Tax=Parapediasia teterrellus TaxID=721902 RepID=UPI00226CB367|nr:NADH dehydrogenase subunit 6 [Parapediasia teterrellus]UYX62351.1 NADH dehydrogenase subunit 6 [Parapediasia teterrellus]
MKIFISMLMLSFSFIMLFLNHPLSMGLMILIQTLFISLLSSMMIQTYWFSYILFLTFLGGLLVLFIYVSSIASNEMFNIKTFFKGMLILMFFSSMLIKFYNFYNLKWLNLNINNSEMNNFLNTFLFFNNENKINLSKLYNNQTYMMMMMMMIYLFICLIAVIKITNIFYGPLRSSIN